jgi:hypothetical protein
VERENGRKINKSGKQTFLNRYLEGKSNQNVEVEVVGRKILRTLASHWDFDLI